MNRLKSLNAAAGAVLFSAALPLLAPYLPSLDAQAIPAWSRKYEVECALCHTQTFARLNLEGERFLWNGYQSPGTMDGDEQGKEEFGGLKLDTKVGHWFTARLNVTPLQWDANAITVENETEDRITIGNANWLQLFVAGALHKNVSVYIENEITPEAIHQAWYYLGLHNLAETPWLNFQVGRVSPLVFAPYPDRLPQLPAVGGGVLRVKSAGGAGQASLDLRSPRHGIQYYGHQGRVMLYGGVTTGPKPSNPANNVGFWAGGRVFLPETASRQLAGSSVGIHFDTGTDTRDAATTNIEDDWTRIMPGVNVRYADRLDVQGAFVIAEDDNWTLSDTEAKKLEHSGVRAVGSYFIDPRWAVSLHYDNYSPREDADRTLLPEQHMLFLPVVTWTPHQNLRASLYPGFDLRDVDSDAKRHTVFLNVRIVI